MVGDEKSISRKAVSFVINYEEGKRRECVDLQTKAEFKGFDVLSFSEDKKEIRAIEVKGTKSDSKIPDLFETEVTINGKLIATHLYLVVFNNKVEPIKLFIISAKEFNSEDFSETRRYRIKSNFYTRNNKLTKFKVLDSNNSEN